MTGQAVGGINQDLSVPSLLAVEGPGSRPLGRAVSFTDEAVSILTSTSQLAQTLLSHTFSLKRKESIANAEVKAGSSCDEDNSNAARRKREFIPAEKKDDGYWDKRKKNNEAAKRSREKRRANDMVLERRVLGLLEENARLRAELLALKFRFGLVKDPSDVSILPLSAPLCAHPTPSTKHFYQPHTDGSSYPNTLLSTHHVHPHPPQPGAIYGSRGAGILSSHSVSEESAVSTSCSSDVGSPVFFDDTLSERGGPSPRELVEEQQGYDSHICHLENNESQYVNRLDSPQSLRSLPHKLRFKGPAGCSDGGETSPSSDTRTSGPPVATVWPNIQVGNHQQAGWDSRTQSQAPWAREEACGGLGPQYQGLSSGHCNSSSLQNSRDTKYSTEDASLRSQMSCLSQEVAQLKRLFSQQLLSKIA
ncbi:nuclear factor interleukin-3-regulated protein-like [Sander lucioperca]|uniref:Nuclear factor interleukin-3-regulated protein-like n=1 Tax=Sander lucioperca TaxID=283035 RepID=A0A8C9YD95_SANLU|nr:nuclear factor interleukin-3-regulated protein-like [Sander lucioperca]XP_031140486.1 nuclear factor interleukin-3-regulated protein-like [Sander lucioperca]XP_035856245.1 nuclear factor interleukin-3-regulated protein-like [Sander lucioperca]